MAKEIVIGWDEWKASRAAKRENLRRLGLGAPSRRTTDYGTSGRRLRAAFDGKRAPDTIGFEYKCVDIDPETIFSDGAHV